MNLLGRCSISVATDFDFRGPVHLCFTEQTHLFRSLPGAHVYRFDLTPQEQQIIEDLRKLKMRRRVRRSAESEMGKEKRNLKEAQVANFKITEKKIIVRLNSSPMLSARRS